MTLHGDGDLGWQPWDAAKDAAGWIADKSRDAGSAVYDAGSWVVDKTCSAATDPRVQGVAIASSQLPSGYTQIGAGVVMGVGGACMIFKPSGAPPPPSGGPPLSTPSTLSLNLFPPLVKFTPPALPAGTIAAFDAKRRMYRVAVPSGLSGLAAAASFTEIAAQTAPPAGARLVDLATFKDDVGERPWFKKPLILGGIGAGVLAAGVGGYLIFRR